MVASISSEDHYSVLELPPNATLKDIKTSYRRLARLYHPDKNNGSPNSTLRTQLINAAWEILGDSSKRRAYDIFRQEKDVEVKLDSSNVRRPSNKSQWRSQSTPRPAPRPGYHNGARTQSYTKRQTWVKYEQVTEAAIRQYREYVYVLQIEISNLDAKMTKLERDIAQRQSSKFLDTRELERQMLELEAVLKARQMQLKSDQAHLGRLEIDLMKRRTQELARLAAERRDERQREEREEQLRKEQLARARLEAEARKQREAAWQARVKEMRQREEQFAAMQAGLANEVRQTEAARLRKMAEDRTAERQARTKDLQEKLERKAEALKKCRHDASWERHNGPIHCTYCAWPPSTFAYECPDCLIRACLFCMTTLKAGCEPADYKSFWATHTNIHVESPTSYVEKQGGFDDESDDEYYDCYDDSDSDSDYYDCWDGSNEDWEHD